MRKLRVDEIDFRVGTMGKSTNGAYCTLLAYKDARVDMAVLDEVYTPELWQNEYRRDSKGVLQCGIGIYNKAIGQWVWNNWEWISGISFLPHTDHIYEQAPFEAVDKETHDELLNSMPGVNWADLELYEQEDTTTSSHTLACTGGSCEIVDITGE